ncbi:MAG: hypothetical protein A2086_14220 [Spirochaetes bacterium GWD1_27_9]|nr:MAG: hypothetical protein A2Z98_09300 [Spirochaetes bacterium GWB1_27_13]OHD23677.1 MAG: hypothetical protein A2Y34_15440 [Spirochaetes bacterium GWC1_27_15]OHD29880.1 MAG: hypothetical protein A2086_14220 [Spirochaetes bacterium GWD1_27_9]
MEALRYVVDLDSKSLTINGLEKFVNKKVEIIIIPIEDKKDNIFSDIQTKLKKRNVKNYSEKEIDDIVHEVRGINN